jgi:FkbM family methyltransferase
MDARGSVKAGVKRLAASMNLDVHRRDLSHPARRAAAMSHAGIDTLLDVGANRGQYTDALRRFGFAGRILSFEPIPEVYEDLRRAHAGDPGWSGWPSAVGAEPGVLALNVSADSVTSSFLRADEDLLTAIPAARSVETVEVPVTTVDRVMADEVPDAARVMLKVDVQGFEHAVLDGARESMPRLRLVEIEMGLAHLYQEGSSIHDLLPRLHADGFEVISIDSGFVDPVTGQVLDIDMLLGR